METIKNPVKEKFNKYFDELKKGKILSIGIIHHELKMCRNTVKTYLLEKAEKGEVNIKRDIYNRIIEVKKL